MNKAASVVKDAKGLAKRGKITRGKSIKTRVEKDKRDKRGDARKQRKELSKEDMKYLTTRTNHSEQEINDWYNRFLKECPSGVLTKTGLHVMYARIMPKEDPTVIIDHLFRIFDQDNNGTIDFKEFVLATDITQSTNAEEKLRWTFKLYDKDGSGTIEMAELVDVLETVYVMEGVTSEHIYSNTHARQIFEDLDKNGDGCITLEEFVEGCMKDSDFISVLNNRGRTEEGEGDEAHDNEKDTPMNIDEATKQDLDLDIE